MQKTKKQDNALIINFLFYFVLSLGLIYFFFSYILIQAMNIEQQKEDTMRLGTLIKSIETGGLSFDEFQLGSKDMNKSTYVSEVLKNITPDFYSQSLTNTTHSNYIDFLNNKKSLLNSVLNKLVLTNRDKKILNVLPSYSDTNEGSLTDFKFISYVEALSNVFNLKYSDPIGIKNVVLLKDFSLDEGNGNLNGLETNLYYIPLRFSLIVDKKNLINFLHYIEKVGNIYIENNDVKMYEDDFLNKNGRKLILNGYNDVPDASSIANYNIYENQMINIEDIKMTNYIDSSHEYRKDTPYLDFIKTTQGSDQMEVDLKLKFFIKGQPNYQLEASINAILDRYANISSQVNNALKNIHGEASLQIKLQQANSYLKEIGKDILDLKKALKNKQGLNDTYKRAMMYDSIFNDIETLLK